MKKKNLSSEIPEGITPEDVVNWALVGYKNPTYKHAQVPFYKGDSKSEGCDIGITECGRPYIECQS